MIHHCLGYEFLIRCKVLRGMWHLHQCCTLSLKLGCAACEFPELGSGKYELGWAWRTVEMGFCSFGSLDNCVTQLY